MNENYDTVLLQKPAFRSVQTSFGNSFSFRHLSNEEPEGLAQWHHHPEIELVHINRGSGKRHIGNHLSYFNDGDLILIGPYLPHFGFAHRLTQKNAETVVQFREDFMGTSFLQAIEMQKIKELLDRSRQGLTFHGKTKEKIGKILDEMVVMSQFDKFIYLLKVLHVLATSEDYVILNASAITLEVNQADNDRIRQVYRHVRKNFHTEVALQQVADLSNMTVPSFCRYFKKQTSKTFTQFVNEFRVIHACKLLSETNRTISDICFECGFNNFSHFNKQFKLVTEKSPSEYRGGFKQVITK